MSKVKVSVEGHYEVQEMTYGKDYIWQPSHALIECDCGQVMDVDEHHTTCPNCATDHSDLMRQVAGRHLSDDVLHPWLDLEDELRSSHRALTVYPTSAPALRWGLDSP